MMKSKCCFVVFLSFHYFASSFTITTFPDEERGVWKGFGTSLAWWARATGNKSRDLFADLFFTMKDNVEINPLSGSLPGLGLNVIRFNSGGCGMSGDYRGEIEMTPPPGVDVPWYREISGFFYNPNTWDWTRDSNQTSMLKAAISRGVENVEFFSNAPMWWMTNQKSSIGGVLQQSQFDQFAFYGLSVAEYAQKNWGVGKISVELFNEPSAGWWNYGSTTQEGTNINVANQTKILMALNNLFVNSSYNFNKDDFIVSTSDENNVDTALSTLPYLLQNNVQFQKYNVHGYSDGTAPYRNNSRRIELRKMLGSTEMWLSEYGDGVASGLQMVTSVFEDINYLQPTAWVYWQAIDGGGWGLVNADFENDMDLTNVNQKYWVLAHFSRFIRPGDTLLGSNATDNTIVAFNKNANTLKYVLFQNGTSDTVSITIPFKTDLREAIVTYTTIGEEKSFSTFVSSIKNQKLNFNTSKNTLYSIEIKVFLNNSNSSSKTTIIPVYLIVLIIVVTYVVCFIASHLLKKKKKRSYEEELISYEKNEF